MTPTIEDVASRIAETDFRRFAYNCDKAAAIAPELAALVESRDARIADLERQLQEATKRNEALLGHFYAAGCALHTLRLKAENYMGMGNDPESTASMAKAYAQEAYEFYRLLGGQQKSGVYNEPAALGALVGEEPAKEQRKEAT